MSENAIEPEQQSLSIVALGDFNPSIFQPLWFSANGLMPKEETENAEISIIQKQLAIFSIGEIQFHVDESRLGLTTTELHSWPILRDLAIGILSILEHTPLKAIGFNRDMVFMMATEEAWNALGDRLVPKEDWATILEKPGMRQVVVEGKRPESTASRLQFRVQPSGIRGVMVAVNQHYDIETAERTDVSERNSEAIRVLQDDWNSFASFAQDAASTLLRPNWATEDNETSK